MNIKKYINLVGILCNQNMLTFQKAGVVVLESKSIVHRLLQKSPMQIMSAVLNHIPSQPFEILIFYSLQVVGIPKNLSNDCTVTIREADEKDLATLILCNNKKDRFLSRLRSGEHCLVAFIGDEVVGYLWFSIKDRYKEELTAYQISIPENSVYSFDEYVSPMHRRKGILSQLFAALYGWMGKNNRDTISILIVDDNEVSWEAHIKKGFIPINKIVYLRILKWRFYRVRPILENKSESIINR